MPADVSERLETPGLTAAYDGRPPYQRNDYLGWINGAKLDATRDRRIAQMLDELRRGDRYMHMIWKPQRLA
jgi:uncharacterized protein YdeI (YjbR/CyaY-like superfamily)